MLWSLVACLAAMADPALPSSPTIAILPTHGASVLPAVTAAADAAVRRAATRALGPRLVSREDTEAVIGDAVAAGLNCELIEVACAVRIGLIAGVVDVLVPTVRLAPAGLELVVLRVDVGRGTAVVVAATGLDVARSDLLEPWLAMLLAPPASLSVAVDGDARSGTVIAIDGVMVGAVPLAAPVALTTGPHTVGLLDVAGVVVHQETFDVKPGMQGVALRIGPPPAPREPDAAPSSSPKTMALTGMIVAGISGTATVLAGGAAIALEVGLSTPEDRAATYATRRGLGQLALGTAAVGGLGVVIGATLIALGGE